MRIALSAGHTKNGAGYGAVSGKYKESEITRLVAKELTILLKQKGHVVYDCTVDTAKTQNEYLKATVSKVNNKEPQLFLTLHCNASTTHTAHGVELYTYKSRKLDKAVHICYELSRCGLNNRGIRDGSNLYVVKNTKAPAILAEMFFLDAKCDQAVYDKLGYKGIAKAIAEAF